METLLSPDTMQLSVELFSQQIEDEAAAVPQLFQDKFAGDCQKDIMRNLEVGAITQLDAQILLTRIEQIREQIAAGLYPENCA